MEFYKNKKKFQFQVGLFFLIALIIFIVSYGWLKDYFFSYKYTDIKVKFNKSENFSLGMPVAIWGINKGKVKQIFLQEDGVLLVLSVELNFPLKKGSNFYLRNLNFMGSKQINIIPKLDGDKMDYKAIQEGKFEMDLGEIVSNTNLIMNEIPKTINNFNEITNELKQLIADNKDNFTLLTASLKKNSESLEKTFPIAENILQNINSFSQIIKDTNSAINKLARDKQLYDKLLLTNAHLDSLILDIRANPKRYFRLF